MYMFVIEVLQKSITKPLPGTPSGQPWAFASFFFKGITALFSGKESVQSVTLTMQPLVKANQIKITAVCSNVDQSKPDVDFNSHIDPYVS